MKHIFLYTLILFLGLIISCNDDEEIEGMPQEVALSVTNSVIQKGPFSQGSSINIQELDDDLSPTGRNFVTQTNNDFGSFDISTSLASNKVDISGTVYNCKYFKEFKEVCFDKSSC